MAITYSQDPLIKQGWLRAIIFCAAYILANFLIGWLAGVVAAAEFMRKGQADVNLALLFLLAMIAQCIIGITLSIVFRRFVDREPIVSLGLDPRLNNNESWAGLLLSIVLLGIGSLIL